MKTKYYIAYGSNLNLAQMEFRCPDASPVGTAVLDGYQLHFRGSKTGSYLTIDPCEGASVPVGVWEISEACERALDHYEGYPSFYRKATLPVEVTPLLGGQTFRADALVYIMVDGHSLGKPHPNYLGICRRGYRDFGLNPKPLNDAVAEVRSACGRRSA